MLNRTTATPIPKLRAGKEPGEASTSAILDFPANPQPTDGAYFPMTSRDLAPSIHNETEVQIGTLKVKARIDVLGDHARSTEKLIVQSKDITIDEVAEDLAIAARMFQDEPLRPEENLMLISMAPRDSYLSVPRDRENVKNRELTQDERLPMFYGENYMLALKSNVSDRDIETNVLSNIDDLCKINNSSFPESEAFEIAKTARRRFNTNILAHTAANMKQAGLGTPKRMFDKQPLGSEKVTNRVKIVPKRES